MRNEKGFTLIELLAVIVILGILMFVAIPMVTRYINNSRKDTFVDNAKMALNQAKTEHASCDVDSTDSECANWTTSGDCEEINLSKIQFEKPLKSPFDGTPITGKIKVCTTTSGGTTTTEWSFQGAGTDGKGFPSYTAEDSLTRANVTA